MDIINRRRSIRQFLPTPIAKNNIELLLKAAMQAPSAKNQQPWLFRVITKRQTLDQLSNGLRYAKMLKHCPLAIVLITDLSKSTVPSMYPQDMAAATQNILLEATSLGIGSCWLGVFNHPEHMTNTKQVLNLIDEHEPFSIIALGYPVNSEAFSFINRYQEARVIWEEEDYA